MRVLVVDAFGSKAEERRLAGAFARGVRDALATVPLDGLSVFEATREQLSPYLFRGGGTVGMQAFDRLDAVFIGAEADQLPWGSEYAADLYTLVKMCFFAHKCVFGCGGAAQLLAFCSATNGAEVEPVNGEQGGTCAGLFADKLSKRVKTESRDVFFDCEHGDLYRYDRFAKAWAPYASAGVRKRSLQGNAARRHFSRVAAPLAGDACYLSKSNECVCRITSKSVNHWLFAGLGRREFVVRNRPTWALDGDANLRSAQPYHVLAESQFAPLVVKSHNFVALHFDVHPAYPESLAMLRNFVQSRVAKLKHHSYIDESARLYLAFHSQSEAAMHHSVPKRRPRAATGAAAPAAPALASAECATAAGVAAAAGDELLPVSSVSSVSSAKSKGQLQPQLQLQPPPPQQLRGSTPTKPAPPTKPELAHPSECYFMHDSRCEYKLVRSAQSLEEKRALHRPLSSVPRKSNYAHGAEAGEGNLEELKALAAANEQAARLLLFRQKRRDAVRFPSGAERPRSAPMGGVRASTAEQLHSAAHKRVPSGPLFDRFDPAHIAKRAEHLQRRTLAPTHCLRVFKVEQPQSQQLTEVDL
jgi:hypothetical protein